MKMCAVGAGYVYGRSHENIALTATGEAAHLRLQMRRKRTVYTRGGASMEQIGRCHHVMPRWAHRSVAVLRVNGGDRPSPFAPAKLGREGLVGHTGRAHHSASSLRRR